MPNPVWLRWDHAENGPWPAFDVVDEQQVRTCIVLPGWLEDLQSRIRSRIARAALPMVIGHADWEAQNLRWNDGVIHTIHDWDSLAMTPEAVLVGAACGAFASTDVPALAPIASSQAFLEAYDAAASRRLTTTETQVAWAASMLPAAHNARAEILFDNPRVATTALREQADERLRLAAV